MSFRAGQVLHSAHSQGWAGKLYGRDPADPVACFGPRDEHMASTNISTVTGSRNYGVICGVCSDFICLWADIKNSPTMKIFVPGSEPVQCNCGSSAVYVSDEVVDEALAPAR